MSEQALALAGRDQHGGVGGAQRRAGAPREGVEPAFVERQIGRERARGGGEPGELAIDRGRDLARPVHGLALVAGPLRLGELPHQDGDEDEHGSGQRRREDGEMPDQGTPLPIRAVGRLQASILCCHPRPAAL